MNVSKAGMAALKAEKRDTRLIRAARKALRVLIHVPLNYGETRESDARCSLQPEIIADESAKNSGIAAAIGTMLTSFSIYSF